MMEQTVYVILYQDHGKEDKILATTNSMELAKKWITDQLDGDEPEWEEWEGDTIYCFGDAQYAIRPVGMITD
jgi:hypothetical protein